MPETIRESRELPSSKISVALSDELRGDRLRDVAADVPAAMGDDKPQRLTGRDLTKRS
jgi:hypothetical protein